MSAVNDLMARSLDDGEDRMSWLVARQGRVTASLVSQLRKNPHVRRTLIEESFKPPVEITGNKYIDRGHEREPIIAAWITSHWPLIHGNLHLFAHAENPQHAATPDGIGTDQAGRLVLAEIKTSKYDRSPEAPYFDHTGYLEQMQWQMYVTGAVATLYVWEQHDDDWENGPTPLFDEPRWCWIRRDDEVIAELVEQADAFLAERASWVDGVEPPELIDPVLRELATQVLEARKAKSKADAALKVPWEQMLEHVKESEQFSAAGITWSNRTETSTVPDVDAALSAPVEDYPEGVTGRDLRDDLQQAQAAWDAHQARFTKTVEKSVQKLTVTQPKLPAVTGGNHGEF